MEQHNKKVLLIDDDPFFLKIIGDAFASKGYKIITANDGDQGIQAYVQHEPDVVISDLIMPRKGGVGACMEISRLAGDNQPIMVLLTAKFDEPPHEHDFPELGAGVHISKRTPPAEVVEIVEKIIIKRQGGV